MKNRQGRAGPGRTWRRRTAAQAFDRRAPSAERAPPSEARSAVGRTPSRRLARPKPTERPARPGTCSYHRGVAMWSCPHCGAVQAASSRCWVCHRSSTTCSTCRHFRTSLAADVGWCALDKRRQPLTGLELRGCWTARAAAGPAPDPALPRPVPVPNPTWRDLPVRGFVPVDSRPATTAPPATAPVPPVDVPLEVPLAAVEPPDAWDARVSLFGDPER